MTTIMKKAPKGVYTLWTEGEPSEFGAVIHMADTGPTWAGWVWAAKDPVTGSWFQGPTMTKQSAITRACHLAGRKEPKDVDQRA